MSSPSETEHALYMFTRTFPQYKNESFLNLKNFSDGVPFAHMLASVDYFVGIIDQMEISPEKWTQKLANLKRILTKMESYVDSEAQKILKINDLELVEIAKNNSQQEILKFFQTLIAVLMQTPEKEDYIEKIMALDERSQQALVIVVQNALQQRISEHQKNSKNSELLQQLTNLQNQNHILSQQINELCRENDSLSKKNTDLNLRLHEYQDEIQKTRSLHMQMHMNNHNRSFQNERQNSLVETLKKKMIQMTREHELQLSQLNDELYHLKNQIAHYKEIQNQYLQRNKFLEEKLQNYTLAVQGEKRKLQKIIDDKDLKLKKTQHELELSKNKVRELSQNIQVNDLNLRIELEKKQVRFKQLEKQVKSRLMTETLLQKSSKKDSNEEQMVAEKPEQNQDQTQFLKAEVQKLRNLSRQLQRENLKLKKKSQKLQVLQNEKKKLQKIVLDVSKCRDSEIQMLVVSLYDLRNQNIRMHEIIKRLKYMEQSKYD